MKAPTMTTPHAMDRTLKALAALLTYPSPDLVDALPEIGAALAADRRLARGDRAALAALVGEIASMPPLAAEERYVALFDRGRATSLHLFEHVHGESRDRGQAMVDLLTLYRSAGLALSPRELPDYLPVLLEFASLQPHAVACELLGETAHLIRRVGSTLQARESRYAAVMATVLALIGEDGLDDAHAQPRDKEPSIDETWAEAPVEFGPSAAPSSCSGARPPSQSVVQFVARNPARP